MTEVHKATRSQATLTPADRPWRIAFPNVHTKRTKRPNGQPLDKPRWDATLLAPKLHNDPAQCPNYKLLSAHCMEAAAQAWGPTWPQGGHWPIQDGDAAPKPKAPVPGQAAAAPKEYPWRKGHWVIEVATSLEPGPRDCILQNGQAVEIASQSLAGCTFYKSGDYVIASISAYTFNTNGKFGCNFSFDGVLFVGEGEMIGQSGPRSAASIFGGVAPMGQAIQAGPAAPLPNAGHSYAPSGPGNPPLPGHVPSSIPGLNIAAPPLPGVAPAAAPVPPVVPAAPTYGGPAPAAAPAFTPPPVASTAGLPPFPQR